MINCNYNKIMMIMIIIILEPIISKMMITLLDKINKDLYNKYQIRLINFILRNSSSNNNNNYNKNSL